MPFGVVVVGGGGGGGGEDSLGDWASVVLAARLILWSLVGGVLFFLAVKLLRVLRRLV